MKMITTGRNLNKVENYLEIQHKPPFEKMNNAVKELIYLKISSLKKWADLMSQNTNSHKSSMKISEDSWSGTKTWEEYIDMLTIGDMSIMEKIKIATNKNVKEFESKYKEKLETFKFDVIGEFFDIGEVLSGVPESWLVQSETQNEILGISIKLNLSYSGGVNRNIVVENISKILGMVKTLENHGVQIKISGYNMAKGFHNTYGKMGIVLENTIKEYDEPLNFKKITAYTSPAQFRRGFFFILESIAGEELSLGYGRAIEHNDLISVHHNKAIEELERRLFQ